MKTALRLAAGLTLMAVGATLGFLACVWAEAMDNGVPGSPS